MKLKPPNKFILRGPHHLYIGAFLIFLAWTMMPYDYYAVITKIFFILGVFIALDDAIAQGALFCNMLLEIEKIREGS